MSPDTGELASLDSPEFQAWNARHVELIIKQHGSGLGEEELAEFEALQERCGAVIDAAFPPPPRFDPETLELLRRAALSAPAV